MKGSFCWTSHAVGPHPLSTQGVSFSEAHPPASIFHYAYLKSLLCSVLLWCPGPRERDAFSVPSALFPVMCRQP